MATSTYLANKLLDHVLKNTAYSQPATVYLALYRDAPGVTGAEVTGGSYARVAIAFASAASANSNNSGTVTFPAATADWGTITYFGICDAASAGNNLFYAPTSPTTTILNGTTFALAASQIAVAFT